MHALLVAAIVALSGLASAHQSHGNNHCRARNADLYSPISRGIRSRGKVSQLASHAQGPQLQQSELIPHMNSRSPGTTLGGTPTNAIPRHYDLTIEPNLKTSTFKGDVVIDLDITQDSYSIFLHARNITLTDWATALTLRNGTKLDLYVTNPTTRTSN